MAFLEHTLDNGLKIISECNPNAYSMAVGFFVNAGSRDESDEISGVSHFLEHMTFKGSPHRSALDINRELDAIGSQSNAYTSEEHTVYYMAVVPDYQDRAIDLLSDMMRPALRDEDFQVEKKVIIEEINKYDDEPPYGAHEKGMAAFFGTHPLGKSVLGTAASVGALSAEQMRAYFESRYAPENMTLVAAGNVNFENMVRLAEAKCGKWPNISSPRTFAPPNGQRKEAVWIHRDSVAQQYIVQLAAGPRADDPTRFAHRVMSHILGDDSNSRMFWEFVDKGLCECAVMAAYEFQDAGITMTFMDCHPDDLQENLERLQRLQAEILKSGVTDDELDLAKAKICSQSVRRAERPFNRLFSVGTNWLQRGIYSTVKESIDQYQCVTREEVAETLSRYPLTDCTTVFAGPAQAESGGSHFFYVKL